MDNAFGVSGLFSGDLLEEVGAGLPFRMIR